MVAAKDGENSRVYAMKQLTEVKMIIEVSELPNNKLFRMTLRIMFSKAIILCIFENSFALAKSYIRVPISLNF